MTDDERKTFDRLTAPFPPDAYRDVKLGRTFTTIDAYHVIARLTNVFGLCGQGWGTRDVVFTEHGDNVAATGVLWYHDGECEGEIGADGDAHVIKGNVAEARKKARTNLISKAASFLGVGLSVYQGRGLDDPYIDRAVEAGTEPVQTPQKVDGIARADEADWTMIQDQCSASKVTKAELRVLLQDSPFCCYEAPRLLAKKHVKKLLAEIKKAGADKGKGEAE